MTEADMNYCTISNHVTTMVTATLWWLFLNLNKRFFFSLLNACIHKHQDQYIVFLIFFSKASTPWVMFLYHRDAN